MDKKPVHRFLRLGQKWPHAALDKNAVHHSVQTFRERK